MVGPFLVLLMCLQGRRLNKLNEIALFALELKYMAKFQHKIALTQNHE